MKERKSRTKIVKKEDATAKELDSLRIFPEARIYKTTLTKKFKERSSWQVPDAQEIKSIIPGEVTALAVKEGDVVKAGAHLLTYEAMKMQNIVSAPFNGVVERIFVSVGDKTPKGFILIYLRSTDPVEIDDEEVNSGDLGLIV